MVGNSCYYLRLLQLVKAFGWSGFHTEFWVWGEKKQDGSRISVHAHYGGSGGMPPPPTTFEFRSSQIASDAIWDKIVVSYLWQNNNNYTQLKDFWGRAWNSPCPLYGTLVRDGLAWWHWYYEGWEMVWLGEPRLTYTKFVCVVQTTHHYNLIMFNQDKTGCHGYHGQRQL